MEKMPVHARLYRRGATFYHRASVPMDIRDTYPKTEETFSLKTTDYREAVKRLRIEAARVDRLFEAHRREVARAAEPALAELTDAQIEKIGEVYYAHLLEEDEELRVEGFESKRFEDYEQDVADLGAINRAAYARGQDTEGFFQGEAEEVLTWSDVNLKLSPASSSWNKLRRKLQEVTVKANSDIKSRNIGEIVETPKRSDNTPPPSSDCPMASDAMSKWIAEKSRTSWAEKTAKDHRIWADRFVFVAKDKPLNYYTKADGRAFKEMLLKLPSDWTRHPLLKSMTISEAAEKASTERLAPMSIKNANKIIGFVQAFWNWAKTNYDGVSLNPLDGMKLTTKTKAKDERHPFSAEELTAIFNAPLYTGCRSERSWMTPGEHIPRQSGLFWVPLIALFTGARSGEIIQLYKSDIREENGILRFELTDDGNDQRLKTTGSHRLIPVHPTLIEFGFKGFLSESEKQQGQRLFPEMPKGTDGYYSSPYSRKFRHLLENLSLKHPLISFHSFRHSFEDACRDCDIPKDIMNALQGHAEAGMAGRYGQGYRLEKLNDEIRKLRYRDLDLSHLKVTS